jgi:hypothetical protein
VSPLIEVENGFLEANGMRLTFQVFETFANPDRYPLEAIETIFKPVGEGSDLILCAHEDEVSGGNATIDDSLIHGDITTQYDHLLFQQVGQATVDSLDLQIEMEYFFPHRLNAVGVDTNALHLMGGLIRFAEVKKSNPFHPWASALSMDDE